MSRFTTSLLPLLSSATLLLILPSTHAQEYVGDPCTIDSSPGVCKRIADCDSVYKELLSGKPPSVTCGYDNFLPIVCCPMKTDRINPVETTPKGPPTTTDTNPDTDTDKPDELVYDGVTGTIARGKCAQYAKSVFTLVTPPTLLSGRKPVNVSLCALKSQKLIVGGTKAEPKEFPHMTAVGYKGGDQGILWLCGGTLVSEKFVLTAAHCTYSSSWGSAVRVRVGDLNLVRTDDGARPQERNVIAKMRFPKYKRPLEYHDIALLKLESPIEFNAWIRPACLPTELPDIGSDGKAVATGWGRVEWAAESGSTDLLKVTLRLVDQSTCNDTLFGGSVDAKLKLGVVDDWQLCAGEYKKDTCQGDSGGPLAIFNRDHYCMYDVIGVTSIGRICGSINPGIYTRVYYYLSWLERTIWPEYFLEG